MAKEINNIKTNEPVVQHGESADKHSQPLVMTTRKRKNNVDIKGWGKKGLRKPKMVLKRTKVSKLQRRQRKAKKGQRPGKKSGRQNLAECLQVYIAILNHLFIPYYM